jgi:uncharacterized protein
VRQTSLTCQNPGSGPCCNAKRTILPKGFDLINLSGRSPLENDTITLLLPFKSVISDMKLHQSDTQKYQTVTGYDETGVEINAARYNYSLIVLPEVPPRAWNAPTFASLTAEHFALIGQDDPDVVILGTGARQRFIHPRLTAALTMRRIGVECMDSQAACRTYNILMGEGRKATLALVIDADEGTSA